MSLSHYFLMICFVSTFYLLKSQQDIRIEELQEIFNQYQLEATTKDYDCGESAFSELTTQMLFDGSSWTAIFNCSFTSLCRVEIYWFYKGSGLKSRTVNLPSGVTTQSLVVENFTNENDGSYFCLAATVKGSFNVYIKPRSPPVLKVNTSIAEAVRAGSVVKSTCTGFPGSSLSWFLTEEKSTHLNVPFQSEYFVDENNNTVSTMVFSVNGEHTRVQIHCCHKNLQNVIQSDCTGIILKVNSAPKLTSYQSSLINDSAVLLSCTFEGFSFSPNIIWLVCSSTNTTEDCVTFSGSENLATDHSVEAIFVCDFGKICECQLTTPSNQTTSHRFNVTKTQMAPLLTSTNFSVISFSGNFNVTLECEFQSTLIPTVIWHLKDWEGTSTVKDSENITTSLTKVDDFYRATLTLFSYPFNFFAEYTAVIWNQNGFVQSPPIIPNINLNNVSVRIIPSKEFFEVDEEVEIVCLLSDEVFPPLSLDIWIISEFDLDYSISRENGSVKVTFIGDAMNDFVRVECEAVGGLLSDRRFKASTDIYINHDAVQTGKKSCSPQDFINGSTCDLVCSVHASPLAYPEIHQWLYFGVLENNSFYLLNENTSVIQESLNSVNYSITLSTYFAGFYQFLATFYNPVTQLSLPVECLFKIDINETGADLMEECSDHTECLAYNAVCDEAFNDTISVCQCEKPYNIPMALNISTSACVGGAQPNELCYNGLQCQMIHPNYNCTQNQCQCDGFLMSVAETNESYFCLFPVNIGGRCEFIEECELYDKYSFCDNGTCACISDYSYKDFKHSCGSAEVLTPGAIAGVVVGCVAAAVLFGFFLTFGRTKRRRRRDRILSREQLSFNSSELEEELEFPNFNSFPDIPVLEEREA